MVCRSSADAVLITDPFHVLLLPEHETARSFAAPRRLMRPLAILRICISIAGARKRHPYLSACGRRRPTLECVGSLYGPLQRPPSDDPEVGVASNGRIGRGATANLEEKYLPD